uniref:Uncharacterized protein n=1 Tax=Panagrolaimus davidi TaxID=227884 RepID=A0A914QTR9_9BILA
MKHQKVPVKSEYCIKDFSNEEYAFNAKSIPKFVPSEIEIELLKKKTADEIEKEALEFLSNSSTTIFRDKPESGQILLLSHKELAIKPDEEVFLAIKCLMKDKNIAYKIYSSEEKNLQVFPVKSIVEDTKAVLIWKSKDCSDETHISILYKPVSKDVQNVVFTNDEAGTATINVRIYTPEYIPKPLLTTERQSYQFGPDDAVQIGLRNDRDNRVGVKCMIVENGDQFEIDPEISIIESETTTSINIKRKATTKSGAKLVIKCFEIYSVSTEISDLEFNDAMSEIKIEIY